jgi:hypothetical protein
LIIDISLIFARELDGSFINHCAFFVYYSNLLEICFILDMLYSYTKYSVNCLPNSGQLSVFFHIKMFRK